MRTKTFLKIICLMVILLPASNLRADSDFLSSDVFYNYRSYETAKKTSENGISEKEYLDYLLSEGHTLGEKVALVSALSSYFEFKDFDDNPDNDSEEDYFVRYAEEFDQLLNTMIIYDSDNSMLPELRLLSVLMSDYRTSSPNVTAYDQLAEEMPQSLAAQSVKVSAFAYDVLYNGKWDSVEEFETDYLNPYLAACSTYIKDADLQIVANVEEWQFYIYQRRVDFYPELKEEFMKKFAHKFTSVSGIEAVAAAEKAIREFYTQYITECNGIYNANRIAEIKENFLTKELIIKLAEAELDYDPFLNAQDCDTAWLETLGIHPISVQDDAYIVCYDEGDADCLTLFIVQRDGKWLINDIEGLADVEQVAEDEEVGLREIGLDEKIGNQTLIDYLADPAIPQIFKSVFLQETGVNDNEETFALIDSLSSADKVRHPFYFVLVTRTLWWSDGAFSEPLGTAVREYAETNTQQFLDYFLTEQVLTESDFIQWSRYTLYDMRMGWETMENAEKYIENLRKRMKENCMDCTPEKLKLIDNFVDYMYSVE